MRRLLNRRRPSGAAILGLAPVAVVVIAGSLIALRSLRDAGSWLVHSDPVPRELDIVFTFAGENARITYSKALFRNNSEARWIISYPNRRITQALDKEGLDTARILVIDSCRNTYSEIDFLARWMSQQPGCDTLRIGLVSASYHMRRIRLTMSRRMRGMCAGRLFFLSFPSDGEVSLEDQYRQWWKDRTLRQVVLSELQKIAYYWLRY